MAPGFRDNLRYAEVATPRTIERYTLNRGGAIYGWEYLPSQSGSKRLSHPTPIEGLYLAGHWTQPGAGCLRVLVSGIHAAELVLTNPQLGEPIAPFRHPDLPPV